MKDSNIDSKRFETAAKEAAERILNWPHKTVRIFHHNDADGLSSGAILSRALKRAGFSVSRTCLEKPYPAILTKIFSSSGQFFIFADFAGRIAPLISKLNEGRNLVVIVDHHPAAQSQDSMVINLDTELYGLKGDRDISASTACFLFAKALSPLNNDLAWMALVGAVGDGFGLNGRLTGPNKNVAETAQQEGMATLHTVDNREKWILNTIRPRQPIKANKLASILDTVGGAGYYSDGAETGISLLLDGWNQTVVDWSKELDDVKKNTFFHEIKRIEESGMNHSPRMQWIDVKNRFSPMGVKMIGLFCQQLRPLPFIDPNRYILGVMDLPDNVPGFGSMGGKLSKLSMRLPPALERAVQENKSPGAHTFFPEATNALGGFSDACHSLAAATVLKRDRIERLVEEMEHRLDDMLQSR